MSGSAIVAGGSATAAVQRGAGQAPGPARNLSRTAWGRQRLQDGAFHRFESLFELREGRLGVVVTFLGMLELAKERLLDIVQEPPRPPAVMGTIYVKSLAAERRDGADLALTSEFDDDGSANDDASGH